MFYAVCRRFISTLLTLNQELPNRVKPIWVKKKTTSKVRMKKKRKHTFIANFLLMDFNKYSILSWDRAKTAARIVRVSLGYIDRMCVERCVRCAMYMDTRKRVDWLLFDKCTRKCTFFFRVPLKTSEEMYIDTEIRRRFFYSPYYHYLSSMHNERSTRILFGCSSSIYARFYVIM